MTIFMIPYNPAYLLSRCLTDRSNSDAGCKICGFISPLVSHLLRNDPRI